MYTYIVSYDLNCPGKNYSQLISKIKLYNHSKICESSWIIKSYNNVSTIRDSLIQEIDKNDSLFVAKLTGNAAWQNCIDDNENIKKILN